LPPAGFSLGASGFCTYKKQKESDIGALPHKNSLLVITNDIAYPADRCGSPTMRTNPGNKMTKRTLHQRTTFFSFFLNTCQRSTENLSRAKSKKYRTSEASTGDFLPEE
jgi:hypothetical protein